MWITILVNISVILYGILRLVSWYLRRIYGSIDISNETNVQGKIVLITGANAGIGKVTAKEFATRDAHVILACRDLKKAEAAVNWIRNHTSMGQLTCMQLDLGSLQSVREFCKEFRAKFDRLDILVNNAGIVNTPQGKRKTVDGFEAHMGVNHLGHFLLTNLLLDVIKKSAPSRIVHVGSTAHCYHTLHLDDLMSEKDQFKLDSTKDIQIVYARSKMATMLFHKELSKKLQGTGVNSYALCPGMVATDIWGDIEQGMKGPMSVFFMVIAPIFRYLAKSPEEGAVTTMYCALSKDLEKVSGELYQHCGYWDPKDRVPLKDEEAKSVWDQSAKLVGL